MSIKEKDLTKLTADLNAAGWFRVLDENGASKDLPKALLTLPPSQIVGLEDALAAKGLIPVIKAQAAFIQADGKINGSGEEVKTITTISHMDAAFNGRFNFPVGYLDLVPYGRINYILAWDDAVQGESNVTPRVRTKAGQLIFATNGLFYRIYTGTWSQPTYIGGSNSNYTCTYAEAADLITAANLTPGQTYRITGVGQDEGIIVEAATSTTFRTNGIRLGLVPAHHKAGTYGANVWGGVWHKNMSNPVINTYYLYCGRVWKAKGTDVGTAADWALDATNWELQSPIAGDFYVRRIFECTYRFVSSLPLVNTKGYVSKQWDDQGNEFGEATEPTDGFLVEYNDWAFDIDGDGSHFIKNELSRCYNNSNSAESKICRNYGGGEVYGNILYDPIDSSLVGKIYENDIKGSIKNNTFILSDIRNCEIKEDASIQGCTIYSEYRTGIDNCTFYSHVSYSLLVNMSYVIVKNYIDTVDFNSFGITGSVIETAMAFSTLTADMYIRDDITPFTPTTGQTLRLETPVYDDINYPIASIKVPAANAPQWTAFDTHLNSYVWRINDIADIGTQELLHWYKEGTNVEVHIHIATNGNNNATARKAKYVVWYAFVIPDSGSNQFSAEQSLTAELNIGANVLSKSGYLLDMGTITGTTFKIGTQIKMALQRIGGTGTEPINDPFVGSIGLHVQKDTLGSRTISAK